MIGKTSYHKTWLCDSKRAMMRIMVFLVNMEILILRNWNMFFECSFDYNICVIKTHNAKPTTSTSSYFYKKSAYIFVAFQNLLVSKTSSSPTTFSFFFPSCYTQHTIMPIKLVFSFKIAMSKNVMQN